MTEKMLKLSEPDWDQAERDALLRALSGGHWSGDGPECRALETEMRERLGVHRALLTTSCTHALETAFLVLGIGPGDEVILPSFTFVSAANAILRCGAIPVFADIDPKTLNLCPQKTAEAISPRTRAICPTHYAGIPCDMDSFLSLAKKNGLAVIEDAAHALGSRLHGKELGTLGNAGCYSFHDTKNIVCGEGGALVTNDPEFAAHAEIVREKGTDRAAFFRGEVDRYTWREIGSSYVLSDLLAALLRAQWEKMDRINAWRIKTFRTYLDTFKDLEEEGRIQLPHVPEASEPNGHLFHCLLPTREERDRVVVGLREAGIQSSFHFLPLHRSPFAVEHLGTGRLTLPATEKASETLLRLPLHSRLTDSDVERIVTVFRRIIRGGE